LEARTANGERIPLTANNDNLEFPDHEADVKAPPSRKRSKRAKDVDPEENLPSKFNWTKLRPRAAVIVALVFLLAVSVWISRPDGEGPTAGETERGTSAAPATAAAGTTTLARQIASEDDFENDTPEDEITRGPDSVAHPKGTESLFTTKQNVVLLSQSIIMDSICQQPEILGQCFVGQAKTCETQMMSYFGQCYGKVKLKDRILTKDISRNVNRMMACISKQQNPSESCKQALNGAKDELKNPRVRINAVVPFVQDMLIKARFCGNSSPFRTCTGWAAESCERFFIDPWSTCAQTPLQRLPASERFSQLSIKAIQTVKSCMLKEAYRRYRKSAPDANSSCMDRQIYQF
jgi:hypothetical protein